MSSLPLSMLPRHPRRRALRAGALTAIGLSASQLSLLRAAAAAAGSASSRSHHSCVFIFLFGGPSHIDLWDMKPGAPSEVRGDFRPVATSVPGMELCEHLPLLAQQADKLCLLRSMTHRMPVHGPACSEIYSGRPYFGPPVTDQATPEDWPSLSSLTTRFAACDQGLPPAAVLPWHTQFNGQDRRIAGQTGGRMGAQFDPFLVAGDPTQPDFEMAGLRYPEDVDEERFGRRRSLRHQLDSTNRKAIAQLTKAQLLEKRYGTAEKLIEASQTRSVFSLKDESDGIKERYGRTKFGQSLLLTRRLVEAGISLVTVNWDDETKSDKISPHWDTHDQNFARLKNSLCPVFDRALATFLADLDERGLLESTLVVAIGEFGRTPKIGRITQNGMTKPTGRDHWPHAFTALLAGGGVRGGQIYGATTPNGGYIEDSPVSPADLSATILRHLGIDLQQTWFDQFQNVPRHLSTGAPLTDLG